MAEPANENIGMERQSSGAERSVARIDHQETVDWLAAHPDALSDYDDEWVAMVGHEIVAHAPSMSEAWRLSKERGHDDPLLVPVMGPDIVFTD